MPGFAFWQQDGYPEWVKVGNKAALQAAGKAARIRLRAAPPNR